VPSHDESHVLRLTDRPEFESGKKSLRIVDLFCGCGGLTLGAAQAAHDHGYALDVRLAVDFEERALDVYSSNFPKAVTRLGRVEDSFDGEVGAAPTLVENDVRELVGRLDVLVAGPPCQGHSDLNNHTRRSDPKNMLYRRVARAAEILRPTVVLIENVPTVRHDTARVVQLATSDLMAAGYLVHGSVVRMEDLGVPQRRRRHALVAVRSAGDSWPLWSVPVAEQVRDLRWAIGDLADLAIRTGWDVPSKAKAENVQRMEWLLKNNEYDLPNRLRPPCHQSDHSYKSMYGRLKWDQPAQTMTSGFGSIGQGRFMHPSELRTLTPHEVARIQGFPDYFSFDAVTLRTALATMIGNAVPPALSRAIVSDIFDVIQANQANDLDV
jgi:DNA (cytosine-5)-methyltransferase 1